MGRGAEPCEIPHRQADLNPRTKRQRQELYWLLLISVGAALRVGEAYSLRWRDCELITLNDKDHTEAVHMWVLGKHSRDGKREDAYGSCERQSTSSKNW